eukprot:scaffold7371_cov120-Skeletonema_dohrnii-CCMP3373.AAC.2
MPISQNLFRRHRGTRGETADETHNDSSLTNNNQGPDSSNGEATSTVNNGQADTTSVLNSSGVVTDVENPLTETNNNNSSNDENDDEIQELVIRTNPNNSSTNNNNEPTIQFPNWTLNQDEINTRREAIRTEIERMQHSNFIHFVVLCLVPTSLLLIVIAAILSEDGECSAEGLTVCEREPRTFVNAFTSRCICEAVGGVLMNVVGDGDGGEDP